MPSLAVGTVPTNCRLCAQRRLAYYGVVGRLDGTLQALFSWAFLTKQDEAASHLTKTGDGAPLRAGKMTSQSKPQLTTRRAPLTSVILCHRNPVRIYG